MNISIKTKFSLIIVVMILVSIVFTYVISTEVVYRSLNKNFYNSLLEKKQMTEYFLQNTKKSLNIKNKFVSEDKDSFSYIQNTYDENNYFSNSNLISDLKNRINYFEDTPLNFEVFLINSEGYYILNDYHNISFLKKYNIEKETIDSYLNKSFFFRASNSINCISLYPVKNTSENNILGYSEINFKFNQSFIEELKKFIKAEIILSDFNDNVLFSTFSSSEEVFSPNGSSEYEFKQTLYKKEVVILRDNSNEPIGFLFILLNENEIIENLREVGLYLFISLFFVFFLMFIISNSMLNVIIDSIKELTLKVNSLREGDFRINLKKLKKRNDEIGFLAQDFEEMVNILKNKIEQLEKISENNKNDSIKLEIINSELENTKTELENKNNNINRINKMLTNRISEITNLYYLIVNISKNITNEKFYNIIVRGIREGLQVKKVVVMEFIEESHEMVFKSKLGIKDLKEKIQLNSENISMLLNNEVIESFNFKNISISSDLHTSYIIPMVSERENKEIFGMIIIDDDKELNSEALKTVTTYIKTVVLAFENRLLYLQQLKEIEKLENITKKLKDSEKMRNIFMANVSHELKVPLVPIKGYTELILSGKIGNISILQRKGLITSLNNAERLQEIIENLLSYSRIESGKYELINRNFNLIDIINDSINHLENFATKKNVKIIKAIDNYMLDGFGDKEAITQVIINILSNSIKFSKENSSVRIIIGDFENKYKITIEDSGLGMDKSKIDSIFKSFKQLEEGDTRRFGGIGLGMTVAKKILEHYGEEISVESELGKGSKFMFNIHKSIKS